jgi:pimeloyl-ACP methyl ester carboxylesterase
LVGVLAEAPEAHGPNGLPAAILLNAGMLHRVGPNRLHVKAARRLARDGFTTLRFDFSGIGDSPARESDLPLERRRVDEVGEAMDFLSSSGKAERFVLLGICSGADAAFDTACRDDRVVGAVLINGFHLHHRAPEELIDLAKEGVRDRYYRRSLLSSDSWRRFLSGKSDYRAVGRFVRGRVGRGKGSDARIAPEAGTESEWRSLVERAVDSLLVYSEGSLALDTYRLTLERTVPELSSTGRLTVEIVRKTDHVFTLLWNQSRLVDLICGWALAKERAWISRGER